MGAANGLTNNAMGKLLTMLRGGAGYSPAGLFLGLFSTANSAAAAGTELTTGQMSNYARQALAAANWESSSIGVGTVTVSNGGSAYTSPPVVVFTGGGFTRTAAAVAVLGGGVVTSIVVTDPGAGYTSAPAISFTGGGGGSGAVAAPNMAVVSRYNALVDFGASTGGTGVTAVSFGVFDAVTAGQYVGWGPVTPNIVIGTNTRFTVPSGQLWIYCLCIAGGAGIGNTYLTKMINALTAKTAFGAAPSFFPALATTAPTPFAHGTEAAYVGYPTAGNPRPQLPNASMNDAALISTNVDVVTNAEYDWPVCTGTGATEGFYEIYDSANVGSGNTICCGVNATGAVSNGITPTLPSGSTLMRMN